MGFDNNKTQRLEEGLMCNSDWTWRVAVAALLALMFLCRVGVGDASAQDSASGDAAVTTDTQDAVSGDAAVTTDTQAAPHRYDLAIAISVSIGLSCLGAGYAVGRVGAAALGAASEKPELLIRGLLFVALAEGIAIYGLLIAILLWVKI